MEAKVRLARIGFDAVVGNLTDVEAVLAAHPERSARLSRLTADAFVERRDALGDALQVIDVRNPGEVEGAPVDGARNVPLAKLRDALADHRPGCPRRPAVRRWRPVGDRQQPAAGRGLRRRVGRARRRQRPRRHRRLLDPDQDDAVIAAVVLGLAIGLALGALGGGGSILAVPVLVHLAGQSVTAATATSLVAVGVAAAVGSVGHARNGRVRWDAAATFVAVGVLGSWVGAAGEPPRRRRRAPARLLGPGAGGRPPHAHRLPVVHPRGRGGGDGGRRRGSAGGAGARAPGAGRRRRDDDVGPRRGRAHRHRRGPARPGFGSLGRGLPADVAPQPAQRPPPCREGRRGRSAGGLPHRCVRRRRRVRRRAGHDPGARPVDAGGHRHLARGRRRQRRRRPGHPRPRRRGVGRRRPVHGHHARGQPRRRRSSPTGCRPSARSHAFAVLLVAVAIANGVAAAVALWG